MQADPAEQHAGDQGQQAATSDRCEQTVIEALHACLHCSNLTAQQDLLHTLLFHVAWVEESPRIPQQGTLAAASALITSTNCCCCLTVQGRKAPNSGGIDIGQVCPCG